MRIAKGNMYSFVTHTHNYIKGRCLHDCEYCYMKTFKLGDVRFDEKELEADLGKDNFIFIGSSCDMFADNISREWLIRIFNHCKTFKENKYLFQSKNPRRIWEIKQYLPKDVVIGTTIESNRWYDKRMGRSPNIPSRVHYMRLLSEDFETMVTIEPIMDFDLDALVNLIKSIKPKWVNVGADSKGHKLPEPSKEMILELIDRLSMFTEVKQKNNLKRLFKETKGDTR